jgi:hypothetical protein
MCGCVGARRVHLHKYWKATAVLALYSRLIPISTVVLNIDRKYWLYLVLALFNLNLVIVGVENYPFHVVHFHV